MKKQLCGFLLLFCSFFSNLFAQRVYDVSKFGLKPGGKRNASVVMKRVVDKMRSENQANDSLILRFPTGTYHFYEEGAAEREYYISNHDQTQPKKVALPLEDLNRLTLEGNGSKFVFHGRMLPISLLRSVDCTLKDFSIDFAQPHISQVHVVENRGEQGLVIEPAPWVDYRITADSLLQFYGQGWAIVSQLGIAFEPNTKRMVYRTSDLQFSTQGVREIAPRKLWIPNWKDARLLPQTVVAMRSWYRPAPGLFLSHNRNSRLLNVTVHYAEGMGLLAQLCENIELNGFGVHLKGKDDPRYFTTQADATHFSGCKGRIVSVNGLYEGMMDDAINVHGTYLKVVRRVNDTTLIARYMHKQTWGFDWGYPGDVVQFVRSSTMETVASENVVSTLSPTDRPVVDGAKEFLITFAQPLSPDISEHDSFGIENLTWTPEVVFSNNTIRNNRARGVLFSTPRPVWVENNLFDHTSGTAILLCGDCNGWFETGACRQVTIRKNRFVNALTNLFQFTQAVISIYPEIPNLRAQLRYFHGGPQGGIVIEENEFDTFDAPILYAQSVDGLIFRNNIIRINQDYPPFHSNRNRFRLERVTNVCISE